MVHSKVLFALLSGLCFEALANPLVPRRECACFTATTFASDPTCPTFTPSSPCIHANCIMLSTTTIPGPYNKCAVTPTMTSYLPCQTACQHGCGTRTTTATESTACRACPTVTTTQALPCPLRSDHCATPDCVKLVTTEVPAGPVPGCAATPTVTVRGTCPTACGGACATETTTSTVSPW